ncbi:hypothetical protein DEU56DRAFT_906187 [Suillus clintonianus]|uniref:uncharacterized protein n=1 Tax=Suillus clintonianus TaxID=1904413 RepID=UPI001B863AF9|nr:uncharacterized protein DEU56DRAFT_906187 [Suillus clintonianus]KAG2157555.1 hypothetical protein DEU56DRAFT_906187 [Suillus clintonianus]
MHYVSLEESEVWEVLPEVTGSDFGLFAAIVKAIYPGCEEGDHHILFLNLIIRSDPSLKPPPVPSGSGLAPLDSRLSSPDSDREGSGRASNRADGSLSPGPEGSEFDFGQAEMLTSALPQFGLQHPSDDTPLRGGGSVLLSPEGGPCGHICECSGGSAVSPSIPPLKKWKGKQRATLPSRDSPDPPIASPLPSPSRATTPLPPGRLRIPGGRSRGSSRVSSAPPPVSHRAMIWETLRFKSRSDWHFATTLNGISRPQAQFNFPEQATRTLLPGAKLGSLSFGISTAASVAPHSLPVAPSQLLGNTLPESKAVAMALRNNWLVHIPLSALSTKSLLHLGASIRSQLDSDQSLLVKEGVLTVSAPHLDTKVEGLMTAEDWQHAWPRLVNMIRCYLPGEEAGVIADDWCSHFEAIYERYDFFLRQAFIHNHSFNPVHWQEEVWKAIVRDHESLAASSQPFPSGGRGGGSSSSFRSASTSTAVSKPPSTPASRDSSQPVSAHRCIFCGKAGCHS